MLIPEWTPAMIAIHAWLAVSAIAIGSLIRSGRLRFQYSRFRAAHGLSGRTGMFIIYSVPLVVQALVSSRYLAQGTTIQWILFACITFHFVKRCLEVLLVHTYGGPIDVASTIQIAFNYSAFMGVLAWFHESTVSRIDWLFVCGLVVFVLGQIGNFAHHVLLRRLRRGREGYYVPYGLMFRWVTTPHYLAEIVIWAGFFLMSRHLATLLVFIIFAHYLIDRSNATHRWYLERFEDYPRVRRRIIPFVY